MKKSVIFTLSVIAIMVLTVIAIIFTLPEKTNLSDDFKEAVEQNDLEALKEIFKNDDTNVIDDVTLQTFLDYIQNDQQKINEVTNSIQKQIEEQKQDLHAVVQVDDEQDQDQKKMLVLRNNKIEIDHPLRGKVDVQSNRSILKKQDDDRLIYGPIYPGKHIIEILFEHELGEFKVDEEIEVWKNRKTMIEINEEEIIAKDEEIQNELFELASYLSYRVESMLTKEDGHIYFESKKLLPNESDLEQNNQSAYHFLQAIIDESSYELMKIDHMWHADLRLIGEYQLSDSKKKEKESLLLFEYDFIFNPHAKQWTVFDVSVNETDQSILELWDSEKVFKAADLQSLDKVNSTF